MNIATDKIVAKKKIQRLVFLHRDWVHHVTGQKINSSSEEKRLYNDWIAGLITVGEIEEDINEYIRLRE